MALHFFRNVISNDHVILDDEMMNEMTEYDQMEWIEEKNKELSYNQMRLIKRIEELKRLKKRHKAYKKRFNELLNISSNDERWSERQHAFMMSGMALTAILDLIDAIDIDDYL